MINFVLSLNILNSITIKKYFYVLQYIGTRVAYQVITMIYGYYIHIVLSNFVQ